MENKTELILIRISGVDRPGLTASVTAILSKYQVDIMDIGQADIHSTLSLGILFKCSDQDSGNIMKELLFKASDLGINIRFYPISDEEYETWVNLQGKNRYILTLLGRKLTAQQIAGATKLLAEQQLNIDGIRRLTGRIPLDEKKANVRACIEFSVRGTPKDREELQSQLMQLSASWTSRSSKTICTAVCADSSALIWIPPSLKRRSSTNWPYGPVWATR